LQKKSKTKPGRGAQHSSALRQFSETHIDENLGRIKGTFENALFFNCTFESLDGLTLKNCVLNHSTVTAKNPSDLLGTTITLDCHTFENVELTSEAFDMLLLLLCKTEGNAEKRRAIIQHVVGHDNALKHLRAMQTLEAK
jgi:hypothetical protein